LILNIVFALFCFPYKKPPVVDISILLQEAFLFNVRFYGFSSEIGVRVLF